MAIIPDNNSDTISVSDELSKFISYSKYASYIEDEHRREHWHEIVARDEQMHLAHFAYKGEPFLHAIRTAFKYVYDKKVVPSMRSLQFGGKGVEKQNPRMFNCAVRHIDSLDAFKEIFYLFLCGCGVGMGVTDRHLSKLPLLISEKHDTDADYVVTHQITDTIEGWALALYDLMRSYHEGNELSGRFVQFDYSLIRAKNSRLHTSGGLAPGHEELAANLEKVRLLLERCLRDEQPKLRTIDAYDVMMFASAAVLSGGIRRAASGVMFDKHDKLMLAAKSGNWMQENPQRAFSNNSILLLRNELTKKELAEIIATTREWGEPGFVFADDIDTLYNPCFEIAFIPITKDGRCGVQFCNLTTINGSTVKTRKDFMERVWAATFIGTLQAAYTDYPFLSSAAKELTEDESLLGVSITGIMDNSKILLNEIVQSEAARFAVRVNNAAAMELGIRPAARVTCVKPEGTSTLLLGSQASGIHPSHERFMLRRVQVNRNEPPYRHFKTFNPQLCETSVWAEKTDDIITFPIELPKNVVLKSDLTAIQHLNIIRRTQKNWVKNGITAFNNKPISHNVSCTVVVTKRSWKNVWRKLKSAKFLDAWKAATSSDEWNSVIDYLYAYKEDFAAVSLLSSSGDKDYPQPPNEGMRTHAEILQFRKLQQGFKAVDWSAFREESDQTVRAREAACAGGACLL